VIHRDLKPGNILLHPDGRAVLVDFGLARDELSLAMTRTGDAVGTPSYMAPEQAAGAKDIDGRVDVYGLGATLYEMITLQLPFEGTHSADIMRKILEEDPVPIRQLNPRVPYDLETIVMHCLAKDRDRRYQTIDALRDDLAAFLQGEEIDAKRPGLASQVTRWVQRNRRPFYVGALSLLFALFMGLTVGLISLSRTRTSGNDALEHAKSLLMEGKPMAAHAAYGKALGLLKDPSVVSQARLAHVSEAFDTLYAEGRFGVLKSFLDALPASDMDRPEYHAFRTRLEGHGYLTLPRPQQEGEYTVWVRGLTSGELERSWRRLPLDGQLHVGQYLVKVVVHDSEPIVQVVGIQRDQTAKLRNLLPLVRRLRSSMALVAGADAGDSFAVDNTEVTRGAYARLLRSIRDTQLREEMEPLDWNAKGNAGMPVTGVSLRQARTAAALLGKHLLSEDEYLRAATGGLRDVSYPWGTEFDVNRVVGDPSYTSQPQLANSKRVGAAPCGAVHLVGNVAELLAPHPDGAIYAAGGHFLSRPDALTVMSREKLANMDTRLPVNGFRMARFLAPLDKPDIAGGFEQRLQQFHRDLIPHVLHEWTLTSTGEVQLKQTLIPDLKDDSLRFRTPPGFRRWRGTTAKSLHGSNLSQLATQFNKAEGQPELEVALPKRSPLRRGLVIEQQLLLRSAVLCSGDVYRLRLPVASGSGVRLTKLILPRGCSLQEVWPAPSLSYNVDGRQQLVWECGAAEAKAAARTLLVQFRRDGLLTTNPTAVAPAAAVAKKFLDAMGFRVRGRLASMITPGFRYQRQCLDRDTFLRRLESLPNYQDAQVEDVITVGDVVLVEMVATKHAQGRPSVPNWPLRVVLRRDAGDLRVLHLMPRTQVDLGTLKDGVYHHARLKMSLAPPEHVRIDRVSHALTELQVRCVPVDTGKQPNAWMTILGCYVGRNQGGAAVRDRLTSISLAGQPGQRADGSRMDYISPDATNHLVGKSEHWLLPDRAAGGWIWERWTYLRVGSRYFLLRAVARGASRQDARRCFSAHERWFAAIADATKIR